MNSSVSTGPGATELMVTPYGAISRLRLRVRPTTPAFEEAYAIRCVFPRIALDEILTILPNLRSCICGSTLLMSRIGALTFSCHTVSRSTSETISIPPGRFAPALFTRKPTGYRWATSSAISRVATGSARSASTNSIEPAPCLPTRSGGRR